VPNLADVVEAGLLGPASLWALARGLAEALVTIHGVGLTHRDLKPGNILMADDGPRVIDFGLAVAQGDLRLTRMGHAIGTLPCVSPEQIAAKPVGPASDVYSLGAVVVFAATKLTPSGGGRVDKLPDGLREVIKSCLQVDSSDRPSAHQLVQALQTGEIPRSTIPTTKIATIATIATTGSAGTAPTESAEVPIAQGGAKSANPPARRSLALVGGACLAAIIVLVVGFFVAYQKSVFNARAGSCVNHSFGPEKGWNLDEWCGLPMPGVSNYRVLYITTDEAEFLVHGCTDNGADWNPRTDIMMNGVKTTNGQTVWMCLRPF
jgi:Protein kinase domain